MKVRSGGPAGGADVANQLALTDRVAFFQAGGEPALMSVQRAVAAIVLQNNGVAVAILAAFELDDAVGGRSEEHTSELQSLMRISYAVFCLKKKKINKPQN